MRQLEDLAVSIGDKAPFRAAMKPVYDQFLTDQKQKDLLQRILDTN